MDSMTKASMSTDRPNRLNIEISFALMGSGELKGSPQYNIASFN